MRQDMRFALGAMVLLAVLAFLNPMRTSVHEGVIEVFPDPRGDLIPIHGYEFYIVDGERLRLWKEDQELPLELEGDRVRVTGVLVEDYMAYKQARGGPITSADPEGRVLLVDTITVLEERMEQSSTMVTQNGGVLLLHIR